MDSIMKAIIKRENLQQDVLQQPLMDRGNGKSASKESEVLSASLAGPNDHQVDWSKILLRSPAGLSRHWTSRPGKLQEHVDPSDTLTSNDLKQMLGRRQLHSVSTGSLPAFPDEDAFDSTGSSNELVLNNKNEESREYEEYDDDDGRSHDVTHATPSSKILTSVKAGLEKTKEGISHGLGSARHRLGLWDEETSTAAPKHDQLSANGTANATATATETTLLAPTPIVMEAPGQETERAHDGSRFPFGGHVNRPLLNDKISHIKEKAKTTAGLSTMGVVLFVIIGLWVACLFRRSVRKRARYAHLVDDSEAWPSAANGEGNALAWEFDEFNGRNGGAGEGEDESAHKKKRTD